MKLSNQIWKKVIWVIVPLGVIYFLYVPIGMTIEHLLVRQRYDAVKLFQSELPGIVTKVQVIAVSPNTEEKLRLVMGYLKSEKIHAWSRRTVGLKKVVNISREMVKDGKLDEAEVQLFLKTYASLPTDTVDMEISISMDGTDQEKLLIGQQVIDEIQNSQFQNELKKKFPEFMNRDGNTMSASIQKRSVKNGVSPNYIFINVRVQSCGLDVDPILDYSKQRINEMLDVRFHKQPRIVRKY